MTWARLRPPQGNYLGPQPEPDSAQDEQPIAWIGRQNAANIEETVVNEPAVRWTRARLGLLGVGAVVALVAIGAAIYFSTGRGTASSTTEGAIPLVTASMPGVSPIASTV